MYDDALHDDLLTSLTALASAGRPCKRADASGGEPCRVVLALPERDDGGGLARFLERSSARRWSWQPVIVAHPVGEEEPGASYPIVVFEGRPPVRGEVIL